MGGYVYIYNMDGYNFKQKANKLVTYSPLPITKILNLHCATLPVLSEAKYRMLCSPAVNISPGRFPERVTLEIRPELSEAVGWDHMTCVDVVPLSAWATILDGQFEKTGANTSINNKVVNL